MDMSENNAKMMPASAEGIGGFKPILSFGELKKGADGLVCVVVQDDDTPVAVGRAEGQIRAGQFNQDTI